MSKTAIFLSILLLYGFQTISGDDDGVKADLAYEVKHTHVEDAKNPLDIYTVKVYKGIEDSIQLLKFVSAKDEFYLLSLEYVGRVYRSMSGTVVIDIDGFVSEYSGGRPLRETSYEGIVTEIVSVRLDNFVVNDMRSVSKLSFLFQHEPPYVINPEGIDIIKRFISEMDGDSNPFL